MKHRKFLSLILFNCLILCGIQISNGFYSFSNISPKALNKYVDTLLDAASIAIKYKKFAVIDLPKVSFDMLSSLRLITASKWGKVVLDHGIVGNFSTITRRGNVVTDGDIFKFHVRFQLGFRYLTANYSIWRNSLFGLSYFGKAIVDGSHLTLSFDISVKPWNNDIKIRMAICNLEFIGTRLVDSKIRASDFIVSNILTKLVQYQIDHIRHLIEDNIKYYLPKDLVTLETGKRTNLCPSRKKIFDKKLL